jgi:hypothetical protein
MYYYSDAKYNPVISSLIDDSSKIIWTVGCRDNKQFEGFKNKITIGIHPELLVLGNKERLYSIIPHLQPRTFISSASNLNNLSGYYEKPPMESGGRGISYLTNISEWHHNGYLLQEEINGITRINGHKSDIRIWIALCSNKQYWISPSCIVRVSREPLSFEISTRITNMSAANMNLPQLDYEDNNDFYIPSLHVCEAFINIITTHINNTNKDNLWTILGLDIIFDQNGQGYILEVNTMPRFEQSSNEKFFNVYRGWMNSLLNHVMI